MIDFKTALIGAASAAALIAGAALSVLPVKAETYVGDIRSFRVERSVPSHTDGDRTVRRPLIDDSRTAAEPAQVITAIGKVRGPEPDAVKAERARIIAIDTWTQKVAEIYGPDYASWRNAAYANLECELAARGVACTAAGVPTLGDRR